MSVPVYDDEGCLVAVVGVGNKEGLYEEADARQLSLFMNSAWRIIERGRILDALTENEERFRKAIEYNSDAVIIVNGKGIVKYANPAMEALTGVSYSDIIDTDFGFPIVEGDITNIDLIDKNGTLRCAEMRVSEIELHGESMFVASLRDFTDKRVPCSENVSCAIKKDYSNENFNS
jgi:PAS domain-containing protein